MTIEAYVDWAELYCELNPLTKEIYDLMIRGQWQEAEVKIQRASEIVFELQRVAIRHTVRSGEGFTKFVYEA